MPWTDRIRLYVSWGRRGVDSPSQAGWDSSVWDGPETWAGSEPDWLILDDCEIRGLQTRRGRSRATDAMAVGTATLDLLLLDSVAGVPVPSDRWSWRSAISIGDELRVRGENLATGQMFPVYRGDIREISDAWNPEGRHGLSFNLTDIQGRLGRVDLAEETVSGSGDRTGDRMHRIADRAEIPVSRRRFDIGLMMLQGTNFARNLASEAEVSMTSEGGDLFALRDGRLAFRQRAWWQTDDRARNVRMVWSNVDVPDADDVPVGCPINIGTRIALDNMANQVTYARAGGEAVTLRDSTSKARYGLQTHRRLDLLNVDDDDVASLASWRLAETAQRTQIIDGIEINPVSTPEVFGVLDTELGDLHRIVWDDGDQILDLPVHVQSIEHRITPTAWRTTLGVWDRYAYTPAAGWDVDDWDVALWS